MVLFVTGLCSFHCFYCPVSDEKMYKDVVFADEKRVTKDEDVLEEARAIRATGAGITGGDPLDAVERTCRYIRLLKAEFGAGFHTHLYTMSTDAAKIRQLAEAGLDEIRFHVPPGLWARAAGSAFGPAGRDHVITARMDELRAARQWIERQTAFWERAMARLKDDLEG